MQEFLLPQSFHGRVHLQIICKTFRAAETNAGNEVPQALEDFIQRSLTENILWMSKAQQLYQHVHMQSFSHLRLHYTKVRAHVPEDSRSLPRRNGIASAARSVIAIEERADHKLHRPMKTTSRDHGVGSDGFMQPARMF
jgi:hypothetical protein